MVDSFKSYCLHLHPFILSLSLCLYLWSLFLGMLYCSLPEELQSQVLSLVWFPSLSFSFSSTEMRVWSSSCFSHRGILILIIHALYTSLSCVKRERERREGERERKEEENRENILWKRDKRWDWMPSWFESELHMNRSLATFFVHEKSQQTPKCLDPKPKTCGRKFYWKLWWSSWGNTKRMDGKHPLPFILFDSVCFAIIFLSKVSSPKLGSIKTKSGKLSNSHSMSFHRKRSRAVYDGGMRIKSRWVIMW